MTRYEQGFLAKCAEYGLDETVSARMLKSASVPWSRIGAIAKDVVKRPGAAIKRYWQLLKGGNNKILGGYRKRMAELDDVAFDALMSRNKNVYNATREFQNRLYRMARTPGLSANTGKMVSIPGEAKTLLSLGGVSSDETAGELRKVLAARLGTAGSLGTAGLATYGLSRQGKSDSQPMYFL